MKRERENDFDIQLFASEDDPSGEKIATTSTLQDKEMSNKIKIEDVEYSPEELAAIVKSAKKDADWQRANTATAQKIAEEKKAFEAEKVRLEGWRPLMDKYESDEHFQGQLDALLSVDTPQSDMADSSQLFALQQELATIRNEVLKERTIRISQQQAEENRIIENDRQNVINAISANGDMFTYTDVAAFASENEIQLLSVAYEILRGSNKNIEHHRAKARAEALVEFSKKAPPRLAPNGSGGGIVGIEKEFVDFRTAAKEAAREFNVYG